MSNDNKSKVLRVRTDSHLKRRVEKLAKRRSVNESHILRQAIIEYVEKEEAAA